MIGQVTDQIWTEFYTRGYFFQKSLSLNHLSNSRHPSGVLFPEREANPGLTEALENAPRQGACREWERSLVSGLNWVVKTLERWTGVALKGKSSARNH